MQIRMNTQSTLSSIDRLVWNTKGGKMSYPRSRFAIVKHKFPGLSVSFRRNTSSISLWLLPHSFRFWNFASEFGEHSHSTPAYQSSPKKSWHLDEFFVQTGWQHCSKWCYGKACQKKKKSENVCSFLQQLFKSSFLERKLFFMVSPRPRRWHWCHSPIEEFWLLNDYSFPEVPFFSDNPPPHPLSLTLPPCPKRASVRCPCSFHQFTPVHVATEHSRVVLSYSISPTQWLPGWCLCSAK